MTPATIQNTENGKVRDYLTDREVDKLIEGAKSGRYGDRDALIIQMLYRHGLRTIELVDMKWDQILFDKATLHVDRAKNGNEASHTIKGDEMRQLRALKRTSQSEFVFSSERGTAMTTRNVRMIVARAAKDAGLTIDVHAHMLRHACGYKLANAGFDTRLIQDYLGHKNIQNTVRYTRLNSKRFREVEKIW